MGDAEREVLLAQRASVARSLGFAEIRAPYDLRITEVAALTGQYVNRGQTLLAGEGVEAVEVAVQFAMGRIGPMLRLLPVNDRRCVATCSSKCCCWERKSK